MRGSGPQPAVPAPANIHEALFPEDMLDLGSKVESPQPLLAQATGLPRIRLKKIIRWGLKLGKHGCSLSKCEQVMTG